MVARPFREHRTRRATGLIHPHPGDTLQLVGIEAGSRIEQTGRIVPADHIGDTLADKGQGGKERLDDDDQHARNACHGEVSGGCD